MILDALVSSVRLSIMWEEGDQLSIVRGGGYDATLCALLSRAHLEAKLLESEEDRLPLGGLPHDSDEVLSKLFSRPSREKDEREILFAFLSRTRVLALPFIGVRVLWVEVVTWIACTGILVFLGRTVYECMGQLVEFWRFCSEVGYLDAPLGCLGRCCVGPWALCRRRRRRIRVTSRVTEIIMFCCVC